MRNLLWSIQYICLCVFMHIYVCICPARGWTNLQGGCQDAEAVKALVELRVCGPSEEGLPALWLTSGVWPPTQWTDPALLTRSEQVTQGCTLAAAFTQSKERPNHTPNNDLNPSALFNLLLSNTLKLRAKERQNRIKLCCISQQPLEDRSTPQWPFYWIMTCY